MWLLLRSLGAAAGRCAVPLPVLAETALAEGQAAPVWSLACGRAGCGWAEMVGRWRVALAVLGTAALAAAGRFDKYRTCEDCVGAGLGWSRAKQKCGGYVNKQCSGVALATDAIDADAEAAVLEAARVEIDAANMAEAKRLALSSPHASISAAVQVQQCGKVRNESTMVCHPLAATCFSACS